MLGKALREQRAHSIMPYIPLAPNLTTFLDTGYHGSLQTHILFRSILKSPSVDSNENEFLL
jgi:hypothetical protein